MHATHWALVALDTEPSVQGQQAVQDALDTVPAVHGWQTDLLIGSSACPAWQTVHEGLAVEETEPPVHGEHVDVPEAA